MGPASTSISAFGRFSWYFFLVSAASTLCTDFCIIKLLAGSHGYTRISPNKTFLQQQQQPRQQYPQSVNNSALR